MSEYRNSNVYEAAGDSFKEYLAKVFTKMGIALFVTGVTAFVVYLNIAQGGFMANVLSNGFALIVLFIAQFGVCIAISAGLTRMNQTTCTTLFYVYAMLTGITFSTLFIAYGFTTVFASFGFTAVMFFACAIIGHTTNVDLSKFSGLLMGGLIALVIASLVSMFVPSLRNSLVISYIGILVFLGLTAWDMQRIKAYYYQTTGTEIQGNLAVYGAFQLYLDFINIFLYVLRILGRNSNRN